MFPVAKAILQGAIARDESRGAHYKPEFSPGRDHGRRAGPTAPEAEAWVDRFEANNRQWLKSTIAACLAGGEPSLSYEDVNTSLIPPRPRLYGLAGGDVIEQVFKERQAALKEMRFFSTMTTFFFTVRVLRQDLPGQPGYWNAFRVAYEPDMNVISALQKIAESPVTVAGRNVVPVVWNCNCLEEVCGSCTMVINGRVRQACTALVDQLLKDRPEEIELRPMTKFPVVRDLMVDVRGSLLAWRNQGLGAGRQLPTTWAPARGSRRNGSSWPTTTASA